MKKLLMLGLALMFMFGISTFAHAAEQSDMNKLRDYALSEKAKKELGKDYYVTGERGFEKVILISSEEKIDLVRTDVHYLRVENWGGGLFCINLALHQISDSLSPNSHTVVEYLFVDGGADGKIDTVLKDLKIVMENFEGTEDFDILLLPRFPKDLQNYLNNEWRPSKEVAQVIFDKEVKYWIKKLNL